MHGPLSLNLTRTAPCNCLFAAQLCVLSKRHEVHSFPYPPVPLTSHAQQHMCLHLRRSVMSLFPASHMYSVMSVCSLHFRCTALCQLFLCTSHAQPHVCLVPAPHMQCHEFVPCTLHAESCWLPAPHMHSLMYICYLHLTCTASCLPATCTAHMQPRE